MGVIEFLDDLSIPFPILILLVPVGIIGLLIARLAWCFLQALAQEAAEDVWPEIWARINPWKKA